MVTRNDRPIDAALVFEGLEFIDASGQPIPGFEYVGTTGAAAVGSVSSGYSIVLPRGKYRVDVLPVDASIPTQIFGPVDVEAGSVTSIAQSFPLGPMATIAGSAYVADGRPLVGASVVAIPTGCFELAAIADAGAWATPPTATEWCLPRPAQTTTDNFGNFSLKIDPGDFALSVRPNDGTRLPWVTQPISVSAAQATSPISFVIPAPFSAGLQLVDPLGNRMVHAIVRAFAAPPTTSSTTSGGRAVELGEAITDENGNYEMYLTLPSQ
jgi:hypothetical protein